MRTPNDLPSVGTEDALAMADKLRGWHAIKTPADMLCSLAAERDQLVARVRDLVGALKVIRDHPYVSLHQIETINAAIRAALSATTPESKP